MKPPEYRQPGDEGYRGDPINTQDATTAPKGLTWIPVPHDATPETCAGPHCGQTIYKVPHPATGNRVPVRCDIEGGIWPDPLAEVNGRGLSHFADCPDRDNFGRGARGKLK